MKIVKRNGAEMNFDIRKIVDAISKAEISEMEQSVNFRIEELVCTVRYTDDFDSIAGSDIMLQDKKRRIQFLRNLKNERIRALLKLTWMRRNCGVGRSDTSAVADQLLLTIPTPPTAETAGRSLWQWGMTCGAIA